MEKNKLILGDCLEIMRNMPDKSIDLLLTDPPYGINAANGTGRSHRESGQFSDDENWDCGTPPPEYFKEMLRVSKKAIIWGGNYFIENLTNSRCWLFWQKPNMEDRDFADGEFAWTNLDMPSRSFRKSSLDINRIHPTQKPLPLFMWCLELASKPGDLILDCYSGSGTTALACHTLSRDFICIEKSRKYFEQSLERYNQHARQGVLF